MMCFVKIPNLIIFRFIPKLKFCVINIIDSTQGDFIVNISELENKNFATFSSEDFIKKLICDFSDEYENFEIDVKDETLKKLIIGIGKFPYSYSNIRKLFSESISIEYMIACGINDNEKKQSVWKQFESK